MKIIHFLPIYLAICAVSYAEKQENSEILEVVHKGLALIVEGTEILKTVKDESTADFAAKNFDKLIIKANELKRATESIDQSEEELEKFNAEMPKVEAKAKIYAAEVTRITEMGVLSLKLEASTKIFSKILNLENIIPKEIEMKNKD